MCTPTVHTFLWACTLADLRVPVGHPCVCGRVRWGTPEELRALDEVARLDAMLAVPWHEPTRGAS